MREETEFIINCLSEEGEKHEDSFRSSPIGNYIIFRDLIRNEHYDSLMNMHNIAKGFNKLMIALERRERIVLYCNEKNNIWKEVHVYFRANDMPNGLTYFFKGKGFEFKFNVWSSNEGNKWSFSKFIKEDKDLALTEKALKPAINDFLKKKNFKSWKILKKREILAEILEHRLAKQFLSAFPQYEAEYNKIKEESKLKKV